MSPCRLRLYPTKTLNRRETNRAGPAKLLGIGEIGSSNRRMAACAFRKSRSPEKPHLGVELVPISTSASNPQRDLLPRKQAVSPSARICILWILIDIETTDGVRESMV